MIFANRYLELKIRQPVEGVSPIIFNSDWRIKFNVKKSASSNYLSFNTAEIEIYNVSPAYRSLLAQKNLLVSLVAGYQDKKGCIFSGIVNNMTAVKNGVDIVTTLYCSSEIVNYENGISLCVQNMTVTDLLAKICSENGIAYELPFTRADVVSKSYVGTLAKVLATICYDYEISAGLNNGVLIFKDKRLAEEDVTPDSIYTFTPSTGILGNPTVTERGVSFQALLNSDIQVNSYFKLAAPYANYNLSSLTKRPNAVRGGELTAMAFIDTNSYNGLYMALSLEFQGDTRGNAWYINIEGSRIWDRAAYGK